MDKLEEILRILGKNIRRIITNADIDITKLSEIRLRSFMPLIIRYDGRYLFITPGGKLDMHEKYAYRVSSEDIKETFVFLSDYSVYAFEEEMKCGYITIAGGHRVGIAGKAVISDGRIKNMRYISFINIRVAHECIGCAEHIMDYISPYGNVLNTLIVSAPGVGKTTLLRCLNFLEMPDNGVIRVNDEILLDTDKPETLKESEVRKKRLHFGLVFQSFNLFPQYTALQNVMLARELLAKERPDFKVNKKNILDEIRVQAEELLPQMGLEDRKNNYPHQLSGGQCQRVAIARALALQPDILCFDEPTSALDPELTGEVLKVLRNLADKKTTMIIVTHEMAFAKDVASQVIFMDDGYILEQGRPDQVFDNPKMERTKQFLSSYS